MAEAQKQDGRARVPTGELGTTGLRHSGGSIYEEDLAPLQWPQAARVYKQMSENDAVIGAMLYGIDMQIRNVDWKVEPFEAGNSADEANAEFLSQCLQDMSHSWADFISEALSMLPYGFSPHEIVYKRRDGHSRRPGKASRYSDGKIGWRKLPIRAQDTVDRWVFDDEGGVRAMVQNDPNTYRPVTIPVQKMLLFRPRTYKNNPQGQSILRSAYRAWTIKKSIEEYEAIRVERDATGIPVAWVPPEITMPGADEGDQVLYAQIKSMVRNLKFNEQAGAVMPLAYDEFGNKLYELEILQSDARTMVDTDEVIVRWDSRIAMTALADFILIGHTSQTGSYSLVSSRTNLFAYALGAYTKSIAEVLNRHAVPRLWRLNGLPDERLAKLVPSDIETIDLSELGTYIQQLSGARMPLFPDQDLEAALREQAGLPMPPKDRGTLGQTTPLDPDDGDMLAVNGGSPRRMERDEADAVDTTKGTGHYAIVNRTTGFTWPVAKVPNATRLPNVGRGFILTRHLGQHSDGSDVYQVVKP